MANVTTFEKMADVEEFDLDAQLAAFTEEQAEAETEMAAAATMVDKNV